MPDDHLGSRGQFSALGMSLIALVWGFAEATLFFIVPDVLLSWIALDQPRKVWVACGWALSGALAGGAVMYAWGAIDVKMALVALEHVPAISRTMCTRVGEQIQNHGIAAVFLGPITGAPYKTYAVQAGARHLNIILFLLASIPARLIRFALVTALTILITRLFPRTTVFVRRIVHVALWAVFYGWYFWNFLVWD